MKHSGHLTVTKENIEYAQAITEVGGYLYINAECDLPVLATVGGDIVNARPVTSRCLKSTSIIPKGSVSPRATNPSGIACSKPDIGESNETITQ